MTSYVVEASENRKHLTTEHNNYEYCEPQETTSNTGRVGMMERRNSHKLSEHEKTQNMSTIEMLPPTTGPKSVKKVSAATLKRRMRESSANAAPKDGGGRLGSKSKERDRKPLF